MKRFLTLLALVTISIYSYAYDFEVDGIYYNITSSTEKTVSVTYRDTYYRSYSEIVVIPSNVTYNGTTYSVTSIGERAFSNCSGLTSVTIPNSVTSIEEYTFYGCSYLTSVTILNSVTGIGDYAFAYCKRLTSITIPNSVMSIGNYAFRDCSGLTSVTIPNSVTSIGEHAFRDCTRLTSVTIPNSVTSIGIYAFRECSRLTSITIPNSITSIEYGVFYQCSGLTSITIPNSVTSIGEHAFRDCTRLTSITIPNSVTSIGIYAFKGCSTIKEIHSQAITPPTAYSATFEGISKDYCKLYVPIGTRENYAFAEGWKEIINIIEEGSADGITNIGAKRGVLVSSRNGMIKASGLNDGEKVEAYTIDGKYIGSAYAVDDAACISAQSGDVIVLKIGKESIKTLVK